MVNLERTIHVGFVIDIFQFCQNIGTVGAFVIICFAHVNQ